MEKKSSKEDFVGKVQEEAYYESMYDFYENLLLETGGKDEVPDDLWTPPLRADQTNTMLDEASDTDIEITCVKKGD